METVEILLVEDNIHDAELTVRSFRKHGIANKLLHLKDGEAALEFIFSTGRFESKKAHQPQVVFLDLKMPKLSGLEVLERIKSDPVTRKIPVVVLTSSEEKLDVDRAFASGANSYIVKPVEFEAFAKLIAEVARYWLSLNQSPFK